MNNNLSLIKIINGLSKTINIANKMLPLYNQIKPIITNGNKMLSNLNNNLNKVKEIPLKKEIPQKLKEDIVRNNNFPTFFQ